MVSDTFKCIPMYISISKANLDDHLRKTVNDMVHFLLNRTPTIPALQPESTKEALF